ncbi:MAG: hypothetical protein AAF797_08280 [Planctomycetota bacterium]
MLPWWLVLTVRDERRWLGRSAGLCPVCEQLTVWDVEAVEEVVRVWFVPVWRKAWEWDRAVCVGCGSVELRDRSERERMVEDRGATLDDVIGGLQDEVWTELEEQEAAWQRIEAKQDTAKDRVAWIDGALTRLTVLYHRRMTRSIRDGWVWLALSLVPVWAAGVAWLAYRLTPNRGSPSAPMYWGMGMMAGVVLGCVLLSIAHVTAPRRYVRRQWEQWLKARFARVQLKRDELDTVWEKQVEREGELVKRLKPGTLWQWREAESESSELS